MIRGSTILRTLTIAGMLGIPAAAQAVPAITLTPPNNARFFVGQRFDLRLEASGITGSISDASLSVDGASVTFSSTDTTGSVTGYNLRAYSVNQPGTHMITATVTDSSGTATASSQFVVLGAMQNASGIKNVIILLGDGMGVAHRTAARIVRYGVSAGHPNGFLNMDKFPGTGLVTTSSLNSIVTDSSPGMACYVSGAHCANGQEGVYPAKMSSVFAYPRVEYLAEYLHRMSGKNLGIVSTADIEDATPAANAIHTGNRGAGQGICDQYLDESNNTGLIVLMGGGRRWFLPSTVYGSSRSTKNDYGPLPADLVSGWGVPAGAIDPDRDLIGDFESAGFTYTADRTELANAFAAGTPKKLLGLFAYGNMNVAFDKIAKRRNPAANGIVDDYHAPDQPMLDEMTDAALKVLNANSPNGFTLMVEGAHIDKQSHAMDADRAIWETLEFDNAVGVCRTFADQHGNTLVLVLADHECAGFSIIGALSGPNGASGSIANLNQLPSDAANTNPSTVPARQNVVGTYDAAGFPKYTILDDGYPQTADIDGKLLIGFGANADRYEGWLSKPLPIIDSLLTSSIKTELAGKGYPAEPINRAENQLGFFVRGQVPGSQAAHTAADIPVSAYSSNSNAYTMFYGVQENTDIFFKIMSAVLAN